MLIFLLVVIFCKYTFICLQKDYVLNRGYVQRTWIKFRCGFKNLKNPVVHIKHILI